MPLTPATRLGAYEIIATLGAGGMGKVYDARNPSPAFLVNVGELDQRLPIERKPVALQRHER